MNIVVTGWRGRPKLFPRFGLPEEHLVIVREALAPYIVKGNFIAYGDASGVDAFVHFICRGFNHTVDTRMFYADWDSLGLAAGPIRNRQMLDEAMPDLVLAFPHYGSRGTKDCLIEAIDRGIVTHVYPLPKVV